MIIVLTGPTGSGKTKFAIDLARKVNADIINADAFQVYKELSIATAKPTIEEQKMAKHHLIDFVPITEEYDVKQYQSDCRTIISELNNVNKNIIIAGGTGLYVRAALYDYKFSDEISADMSKFELMDNESVHNELKKVDPKTAELIHQNNRIRVLRALKIFYSTGIPKSVAQSEKPKLLYDAHFYEIETDRSDIYKRIEERVDKMFDDGLVDEVTSLIKKYGRNRRAFNAIGVKEFFPYFDNVCSLDEVKYAIKKATRNYIKRQETFFKHQFNVKKIKNISEIIEDLHVKI